MINCVYFFLDDEPNINTKQNTKNTNTVSKYVKLNVLGTNEIAVLTRIKLLPNCSKHFHVFESIESVKFASIDNSLQVQKQIQSQTLQSYNLQSYNLQKDNQNMLLRYADQKLIYLDGYLRSLSCSRKYIYLLTDFYTRLLKNIDLLVGSNIVHNNIGFKTIVVNSFELPILTNFRFSLDLSNPDILEYIKHVFIQYNHSYIYWPPEIHLLSYILTNKMSSLSLNNIETVINAVCYDKDTATDMKDQIIAYFSKYVNCSSNKIIADILRFSNTWDQYALGISYLNLLLQENIKTSNNFVVMFLELLQETVHMIPLKRPTVTKTLAIYQQLIDNCDINDLHLLTKCI
jgi:hypothetical protein